MGCGEGCGVGCDEGSSESPASADAGEIGPVIGQAPKLKVGQLIIYDGELCEVVRVTFCSAAIQRVGPGKDKREIHISPYSEVEYVR